MGSLTRQARRNIAKNETSRNKQRTLDLIESRRNLGVAEMLNGMIQQGISKEDLAKEFQRGYDAGVEDYRAKNENAAKPYIQAYCASVALVLHEHNGFDAEQTGLVIARAMEILNGNDWFMPEDLTDRVKDEVGLDISTLGWN